MKILIVSGYSSAAPVSKFQDFVAIVREVSALNYTTLPYITT